MLDYDSIAKILRENSDVIPSRDRKKVEKFLEAYVEKNYNNMERIVKYWIESSNPILSLLNIDIKVFTQNRDRKHLLYKVLEVE